MAGKVMSYEWTQAKDTVNITIKLNPKYKRKKDVLVDIKQSSIFAGLKAGAVAVKGKLFNLVEADSSVWTIEKYNVNGKVVVVLELNLTKTTAEHWPVPMKEGIDGEDDMDPTSHYLLSCHLEKQKDYEKALHHLRNAADAGLPKAMCKLAQLLQSGSKNKYGVTADDSKSLRLCQQAAEQGLGEAWLHIGHHYRTGRGTPVDFAAAENAYRKAIASTKEKAVAGKATYSLSLLYADGGPGVERNEKAMVEALIRGAALDSAEAHQQLGRLYMKAKGPLPQNKKQALIHFEKAHRLDSKMAIPQEAKNVVLSPRSRKVLESGEPSREWTRWDIVSTGLAVGMVLGAFYLHHRMASR